MFQFLQSCVEGIRTHWIQLTAGVSVTTLAAVIFSIVKLVLQGKSVKASSKAAVDLVIAKDEMQTMTESMRYNGAAVDELAKEVKVMKEEYKYIDNKLSALINAMSVAYSTISNDDIRTNVQAILGNSQYEDKKLIDELKEQLKELQDKFAKVSEVTKDVAKEVSQVKESSREIAERY